MGNVVGLLCTAMPKYAAKPYDFPTNFQSFLPSPRYLSFDDSNAYSQADALIRNQQVTGSSPVVGSTP